MGPRFLVGDFSSSELLHSKRHHCDFLLIDMRRTCLSAFHVHLWVPGLSSPLVLDGWASPPPDPAPPVSYLVDARLAVAVQCAGLHVLRYQSLGVQEVQRKAFFLRSQEASSRGLEL